MGEVNTNYFSVGIVGIVAFVAIAAMMIHVQPDSIETQPTTMHGAAVFSFSYADIDYTGDGRITEADSAILAQAIQTQVCPRGRLCDLNGDGVIDERDLEIHNTLQRSYSMTRSEKPSQPVFVRTQEQTVSIESRSVATRLA